MLILKHVFMNFSTIW